MRTRSYVVRGKMHRHYTEAVTRYVNGVIVEPNPWSNVTWSDMSGNLLQNKGTITDMVRSSQRRSFDVHPCTHTKTVVDWKSRSGSSASLELYAKPSSNDERVMIHQQHSPCSYALSYMQNHLTDAFLEGASASDYTSSAYVGQDWFALQDSFREACDSFIPSNMLLGETVIEYGILADIVKIAINPTRIIPSFIKLVKDYGLEKSNLGRIKRTLKHASRGTLTYSFAVAPAISDIKTIFNANRKVSSRMDYLVKNGGEFVPVRVRRELRSSISNSDLSIGNGSQHALRKNCTDKFTRGTIGGWGRVREEINHSEAWKAYSQYFGLSKIAGLAWELVPFSFVLDWFTNTQERINYLTRFSTGSPFTEFRGITYSLKQATFETVYLIPGVNPTLGMTIVSPSKPMPLFTIEKSSYARYLNIPSTSGVVDTSTLGLFHAITGGALLIQRFLR